MEREYPRSVKPAKRKEPTLEKNYANFNAFSRSRKFRKVVRGSQHILEV